MKKYLWILIIVLLLPLGLNASEKNKNFHLSSTQITPRVLSFIKEAYIDQSRINYNEMLKSALDAFVNQDPVAARALIPRDKEIDDLNRQIHQQLANQMMRDPDTITRCLHLMVVSKSIERIADHAKNVAEEVVFLCEARDIRHASRVAADVSRR